MQRNTYDFSVHPLRRCHYRQQLFRHTLLLLGSNRHHHQSKTGENTDHDHHQQHGGGGVAGIVYRSVFAFFNSKGYVGFLINDCALFRRQ